MLDRITETIHYLLETESRSLIISFYDILLLQKSCMKIHLRYLSIDVRFIYQKFTRIFHTPSC